MSMYSPGRDLGRLTRPLAALADPVRRRILELLRRRGGCSCEEVGASAVGLCVCDLQSELRLRQPTITHHVHRLRDAGLIETRKIGRWLYCSRNEKALVELAAAIRKM